MAGRQRCSRAGHKTERERVSRKLRGGEATGWAWDITSQRSDELSEVGGRRLRRRKDH